MTPSGYEKFEFDLVAVVKKQSTVAPIGVDPPPAKPWTSTFGVGLLFAASLWDAYYRCFRFLRMRWLLELLDSIDALARITLAMLSVIQAVEYWIFDTPDEIELSIMGSSFYAISALSITMYATEHLAGRFSRDDAIATGSPELNLALQLFNRIKFANAYNALIVTLVYLAVGVAVALSLLTRVSRLEIGEDNVSLSFVIFYIVCEGLYAFARLHRFQDIAEQGPWAAHVAGLHTLWSLCLLLPFGALFVVHVEVTP